MKATEAWEKLREHYDEPTASEALEVMTALLRRDWDVRVLDEAADAFEWPPLAPVKQLDGTFAIALIREVNGLAEPFEAT